MILATAETAITIMAASIPVLRALIRTPNRRCRNHSAPHFYESYTTENRSTLPPWSHNGDRGLVVEPEPAFTTHAKSYDALPISPFSNATISPGEEEWPRFVEGSWFSSASEEEMEIPTGEEAREKGTKL